MSMELRIITPEQVAVHTIAWFECETPTGNYVIQSGHAPMLLALAPNHSIHFRLHTGKQESLAVRHGVVSINRTSISVLVSEKN